MKWKFDRRAWGFAAGLLLAGCGGGGGGEATSGSTPQAVPITESSAPSVAAHALAVVQNTSSTDGTGFLLGVEGPSTAGPNRFMAMARIASLAAAAPKGVASAPTGAAINETVACDLGGSLNVSGNWSSAVGLLAGDNLSLSANNCRTSVDGFVPTMNGRLTLQVVSGSLAAYPFHVVMTMAATDFSVQSEALAVVSTGDVRLDWTGSSATVHTLVATGAALTSRTTTAPGTRTDTLKDYSQSITVSGSTVSASLSATVQSDSARLGSMGAIYTISTLFPLTWNANTQVATVGWVSVIGASNSRLMITVGRGVSMPMSASTGSASVLATGLSDSTHPGITDGISSSITLPSLTVGSSYGSVTVSPVFGTTPIGTLTVFTVGDPGTVSINVDANGDRTFEKVLSSTLAELAWAL